MPPVTTSKMTHEQEKVFLFKMLNKPFYWIKQIPIDSVTPPKRTEIFKSE